MQACRVADVFEISDDTEIRDADRFTSILLYTGVAFSGPMIAWGLESVSIEWREHLQWGEAEGAGEAHNKRSRLLPPRLRCAQSVR